MHRDTLTRQLVTGRAAIGLGAWLAPAVSGRLFGLDATGNPQSPYLARLFGARDVALAYGLAVAADASQRSQWLRVGVACDLADAAAGALAGRSGTLGRRSAGLVTGTALVAAALGAVALARPDPPA